MLQVLDRPAFPHRGVLVDTSRNFVKKQVFVNPQNDNLFSGRQYFVDRWCWLHHSEPILFIPNHFFHKISWFWSEDWLNFIPNDFFCLKYKILWFLQMIVIRVNFFFRFYWTLSPVCHMISWTCSTGILLVREDAKKVFFFNGPSTKRGWVRAWPLRKKSIFLKLFFSFCSQS